MTTLTQKQTPVRTPEQLGSAEFVVPDVMALHTMIDTSGEPYVAVDRFQVCDKISAEKPRLEPHSVVYNAIDVDYALPSVEPDAVVKALLDNRPNQISFGTIEIAVLESLPEHPNIIKYLGQGTIEAEDGKDYRFIAMERVNFGTLANPKEVLSDSELELVLSDVAYGLAHLEEFHLVHCDIKPGNIGLHMEEDGTIRGKLLDFGSARPVNDDPDAFVPSHSEQFDSAVRELHAKKVMSATSGFVSPEVARGGPLTNRTDTYSLGRSLLTIYDISRSIGDYPASEGESEEERGVRPDIRALPDRIPQNIGTMLVECLQKDPDRRIPPGRIPELLAA